MYLKESEKLKWNLKLASAIFYQIFIFQQMIALQKLWKMFFISSKKLFLFSRYSNFCVFVHFLFDIFRRKWHWNLFIDREINKEYFYGKIMQKILIEVELKPEKGGGGIFKVSLHNWQRGYNSLVLWSTFFIANPFFFQLLSNSLPITSNPTPSFFYCPVSLAQWVIAAPHLMWYFT